MKLTPYFCFHAVFLIFTIVLLCLTFNNLSIHFQYYTFWYLNNFYI